MTGTRIGLRRWSGCNLHWYGPKSHKVFRLGTPPLRRARYKLYIPLDQFVPGSRTLRDSQGDIFVWMGTDCGWEWMATRPLLDRTPLYRLFYALHDHVHTAHREDRMNIPLEIQRRIVSGFETIDVWLDKIPSVEFQVSQRDDETFNFVTRVSRNGLWGCRFGVANISNRLDERWATGVWQKCIPFSVTFYADELSEEDAEAIRHEIATDVTIDRSDPAHVRVTWVEPAVDKQSAIREARAAIAEAGVQVKVSAFTWPVELDPAAP